jgi:hypothetical protein
MDLFFRGSHTTNFVTCGFSESYNQAAEVPENVPRGANLPNRFPPSAFPYLPEKNHCVCPQGKVLHPAGQRKRRAE